MSQAEAVVPWDALYREALNGAARIRPVLAERSSSVACGRRSARLVLACFGLLEFVDLVVRGALVLWGISAFVC
jgi:hypothetical protein